MKIVITNKQEGDKLVAREFINLIKEKPNAVLGLATGSTVLGVYSNIVDISKKEKISFKKIKTFNLDEYIGLPKDSDQSYRYFMDHNLFNKIDILKENTHFPENERYDEIIERENGVDIQLLGIGSDCHIAFNEPGTSFDSKTHVSKLEEQTRIDNSRFFNSIADVPTEALTMGISTIMKSKKIVLVAYGKQKAQAIFNLLNKDINEKYPASILKNHSDFTLVIDEEASSLLKNS